MSIFDADVVSEVDNLIEKPLPFPKFISGLAPSPGATGTFTNALPPFYVKGLYAKGICINLNEGADELWELGDPPEKTQSFWRSHLYLTLDRYAIPIGDNQAFVSLGSLIIRLNRQGQITRKFSDALSTCFKTDLTIGGHVATVSVTTTAKRTYSYSWPFRIDSIQ